MNNPELVLVLAGFEADFSAVTLDEVSDLNLVRVREFYGPHNRAA